MVPARRSVRRRHESRPRPPSGLCSPRKSVAIRRGFRPPATRCSLGFVPLQGPYLRAWPDGSHRAAPVGLARGPFQQRKAVGSFRSAALRSVSTRRLARSLSRASVPHEVSHLVTPLGGSKAATVRAMCSLPVPSHVAALRRTFFGPSRNVSRSRYRGMLIPAPCRSPSSDRVSVSRDTNAAPQ
jgi:hypothetical protein